MKKLAPKRVTQSRVKPPTITRMPPVNSARALLRDPRILILDEATSALDAESENQVQVALDRLMQGRTTIMIAHRYSTIAKADRLIVMSDGQIVQSGVHDQLVRDESSLYYRLMERQLCAV